MCILDIIKKLIWQTSGLEKGSVGTIVIPTSKCINISTDDYVVEGIIKDDFNLKSFIKKYQLFKVVSVDDNRKGGLKHYKIGVSEQNELNNQNESN